MRVVLSSRDAEAVIGLAQVAARCGNAIDAEREFRRAVALEPHYWRTYGALGSFLFSSGRFKEAEAEYERLTELAATDRGACGNLASARYMQGNVDGALAAWQKAIALKPGALEYASVGTAYFFLGRYAEATDNCKRPQDCMAGRGSGNRQRAADRLRRALHGRRTDTGF